MFHRLRCSDDGRIEHLLVGDLAGLFAAGDGNGISGRLLR